MRRSFLILFFCIPIFLFGQTNLRSKTIPVATDTVLLDTLSIVPESFELSANGAPLDPATYALYPAAARLVWLTKPASDSALVSYRVLPILLTRERSNKSTDIILQTPEEIPDPFAIYTPSTTNDIFDFGGLDANGSFARGISFGNNQDAVFNSSFNLQLAGKLGDVDVVASMTDANLPIQPEGNTQQIQEFDKVFIQFGFNEGRQRISVGDLQITRPESYFMNFTKKLQGGQGVGTFDLGNGWTSHSTGSAAVSKGQYARNTFSGIEGNQGPYRLRGNDGESFIIVLAGTERVYIDGRLMLRGDDLDYVIDYNIGEVTFTPKHLITKDTRIVVEFEYSVQNYFRSLVHLGETIENENWKFRFNLFSEQDAKNQPILLSFDDSIGGLKRDLLQGVGDDLSAALFPGEDSIAFDENIRMYKRVDTVVNLVPYDSVFVFSSNPDSAFYQVSFSFVGEGSGNYRIATAALNGRVYEWVAPVAGIPQGSYEPVILLITPKKSQMLTVGGEWSPSEGTLITTEVALSNNDLNTFSKIGDNDDQGMAARLGLQRSLRLATKSELPISLVFGGNYEYTGNTFQALDAYRSIEFSRDWTIGTDSIQRHEHLADASVNLVLPRAQQVGYQFTTFQRVGDFSGFTHTLTARLQTLGFDFSTRSRLMHATASEQNSYWLRPFGELSKTFGSIGGIRVGWQFDTDDRRVTSKATDSLLALSHKNGRHTLYLQTPDTADAFFRIQGQQRIDNEPLNQPARFARSTIGRSASFSGALQGNPANRLSWNLTYRNLEIVDTSLTAQESEESYLGRTEYSFNVKKGLVRSTTLYEVGSGRELRREFTYLQVQPGQGNYIWNDNDSNGLQELYEFELASAIDLLQADYIRVLTPTSEYISANVVTFNQVLHLEPSRVWRTAEGARGVVGRFSNSTYVQITRKALSEAGLRSIDPFTGQIEDTAQVSANRSLRNVLYYNRTSPVFSAEFSVLDNSIKSVITYGPEERARTEQSLRTRLNIGRRVSTQVKLTAGRQRSSTPAFTIRDYNYTIREAEPKVTYQQKSAFRVSLAYSYSVKLNAAEFNSEKAVANELTAEAKYSKVSKSTLTSKVTYAAITFNGDAQSSLAYAMLGGLQPGNNFVWNLTLERTLANNFQLAIAYDGRKSEGSAFIHIGSAQVRAVF